MPDAPDTIQADRSSIEAWLPVFVLGVTLLLYAASLTGEWVWDDVPQFRDNPAITNPWVLVTNDIWGPTGQAQHGNTPVYRPLPMLSHVPGQMLLRGPAVERTINLLLHLFIAFGVAALAMALGASRRAAWFGAALFAWHPALTEPVAWVSCRAELMGAGLMLGGVVALIRGRSGLAGLLFGLAPFCKETFLLLPAVVMIFMVARQRWDRLPLAGSIAGCIAYLLVRHLLGISIPEGPGASMVELLGAVGAVAVRGIALFSIPIAPDALPPFVHRPWVGGAAIILVLPALRYLPGRLWLATLVGALPVLVLAAPVSMANGVVSDRYFYAAATLLAAGAALLYAQLERMHAPWARALPALVALPLLCVPFATSRSLDWLDTGSLFEAAVQTHPQNPEAQFRLAHHLHTARGDCEAAIGLYRAAMWGSSRAGNNLQACFLDLGRTRDAAALGPQLIANDPENPNPALNTARAYVDSPTSNPRSSGREKACVAHRSERRAMCSLPRAVAMQTPTLPFSTLSASIRNLRSRDRGLQQRCTI